MKDINGIEIKIGDTVRTQQPSGGVLGPVPSQTGTVVEYKLSYQEESVLAIIFKRPGKAFNSYILLDGKINEIVS